MEDKPTITTALKMLFEPGDVFEIRILDAVLPNSNWQHTESGYFDYDHIGIVPNALANFKTYAAVYVTLNPVNPDLIARANNRFKSAKSRETTSDKDILYRRWMLVDIDPVRPAGISATETEKSFALDKALEIHVGLESIGWPKPVTVDSGNGTQLLYLINLPADDDGLIQKCLQALSACSTDDVHVDLSVHNAARICRLPGTWNRKGDSIESRPHRIAEILEIPEDVKVVSEDLLRKLAAVSCSDPEALDNSSTEKSLSNNSQNMAKCNGINPQVASYDDSNSLSNDFNRRGDITRILEKHGWKLKSESDQQYWWRPGKTTGQHSATYNGDVFYVWSDNASPFESRKGYSRFAVYTMLEHKGDYAAASRDLEGKGYGGNRNSGIDISAIVDKVRIEQTAPSDEESKKLSIIEKFEPKTLKQRLKEFRGLNKPIIHGLLREGETMNVIASSKVGKSWLTSSLCVSVATGIDWLGFGIEQGDVLHVDNELHDNTSTYRYKVIAEAMNIDINTCSENITTISLRGRLANLNELGSLFMAYEPGRFKVVVIDAFYRTLPDKTDENDNGAIANLYNKIDLYASHMKCAFILIHHSSKGNQALKSVTDVGAGAGSQSRAVDTHLVIRPHEEENTFVMESAIRSWAPVKPIGLIWEWPLFSRTDEVDTSALLGLCKKTKSSNLPSLGEFVETCIASIDPCSQRSIIFEAKDQYAISERSAKEMLDKAMVEGLTTRIKVDSKMKYVKVRDGVTGDKAQLVVAVLSHNPDLDNGEIAQMTGSTERYIRKLKSGTGPELEISSSGRVPP